MQQLPATEVSKSKRDGWQASTVFPLGHVDLAGDGIIERKGERMLTVHTWKSGRGGVMTQASVSLHQPDGCTSHVIFGDFSERLADDRGAKCTEKNVREQHARILSGIEGVLAKAKAFYEKQDAEKREQAAGNAERNTARTERAHADAALDEGQTVL